MNYFARTVFVLTLLFISNLAVAFTNAIELQGKTSDDTSQSISLNIGLVIFPPLAEKKQGGKCFGQALDSIKRLFVSPKFNIQIICASPARIFREFAANKLDLTMHVKSNSRAPKNILYSAVPYKNLDVMLYKNVKRNAQKVSSTKHFEYHGMREKLENKGMVFVDQSNPKEAIAVFLRGGSDYLISYRMPFEYYLKVSLDKKTLDALETTFEEQLLTTAPIFYVVNSEHPHANEIMTHIDSF